MLQLRCRLGEQPRRTNEDENMRISNTFINEAKTLAADVHNLEYGTEQQIDSFNEICLLAVEQGLQAELEDYVHGATDIEIADWIVETLSK